MKFPKVAKTYVEQLALLKERGLLVTDDADALRWLRRVSYYRLSAYFPTFKISSSGDIFIPGTPFDSLIDLYVFDCRLRSTFMIAIERIEISLRTTITYDLAHAFGPFGHTMHKPYSFRFLNTPRAGSDKTAFVEFMESIEKEERRGKEVFIYSYREKYVSEEHLPIWMATELMSFGTLSMMFSGLQSTIRTRIAARYKLTTDPFTNWLHVLSTIRNLIAHHSRLWNRQLGVQPMIPRGWGYTIPRTDRVYCVAVIIQYLLSMIGNGAKWKGRLFELLDRHPKVSLEPMGFPSDWRELAPWK